MISLSEHGGNGEFLMILSSGTFKRKNEKERQKEIHRHTLLSYAYTCVHVVYVDTHVLVCACTCIYVCCVHCFGLSFCDCDWVVLNKAKNVDLEEYYLFLLYLYLEK